ncbi:MAG: hypothetical protein L0Y72_13105 [Gemmataceae bacterium]|nr:hypothetical protein [Gemmataceae bacterium]
MPTIEISDQELLQAVQQMEPHELDAFIEQALALRTRPRAAKLSAEETELIQRINQGLPEALSNRYKQLLRKRAKANLTGTEHSELLRLTHDAESRDAERASALLVLAKLRRVPVRSLMKEMGIKPPPING